ncbi:unnamed protein product [Musa banksii]
MFCGKIASQISMLLNNVDMTQLCNNRQLPLTPRPSQIHRPLRTIRSNKWPATEYDATRPPRILHCIPVPPFHWLSAVGPLWFNSVGPAKLFSRWVEAWPHGASSLRF